MKTVLRHLRHAALSGVSDTHLLDRFLDGRDEAAFEALLHRHGPMVWGVCRRLLGNRQDVEDAFQATFLVLVRKAASVRPRDLVGHWLYGVAYRTALRARTQACRRAARERQVCEFPEPPVASAERSVDWLPLLDHEVNRLPVKYRLPIVLCDLEGQARRAVARQLQIPEGTLSSRLAYARRLLADRLARRGVTLTGGAWALFLSEEAAAGVPAALVPSMTQAAVATAAGRAAGVSAVVTALTTGELHTMFATKLRAITAAVLMATLGAGGFAYHAANAQVGQTGKPANDSPSLRRENELLKLNLEVVLEKVRSQAAEIQTLKGELAQAKAAAPVVATGWAVTLPPELEKAMSKLQQAPDLEARRKAAEALEKELQKYRQTFK